MTSASVPGTAVQDNLFELFRAMATSLPGGEIVETDTLSYHHASPTNPMFKGIWNSRLADDDVDDAIAAAIAWFQARGAPYAFWWTGPGTEPANIGEHLQTRGFVDWNEHSPGMVAQLDDLDEPAINRVPGNFRIERVRDAQGMDDFANVFVAGFGVPDWAAHGWVDATTTLGFDRAPWQPYVGYVGDKPVASNLVFCGAGVASVYGIATIPDVRGQGIGAAITLAPLLETREQGYRHAVLFATELGLPVYERIGFRLTGVRINRYLWSADQPPSRTASVP